MVVVRLEADVKTCWRCGKPFFPNVSGNCLYCGYSQDERYEIEVRLRQIIHDISGENTSTYRTPRDPVYWREYRRKRKRL